MTEEEVKRIVKLTVEEMRRGHDVKDMYIRLEKYFLNLNEYIEDGGDPALASAILKINGDEYYPIIPLKFNDLYTDEQVAEIMNREVSTIRRNKKKLCLKLMREVEE